MSTNTPDRKRRSILVLSLCIHLALLYLLFFTKDHNFDTQQLLFEQLLAQQKEKLQKEELSEEELDRIRKRYEHLAQQARKDLRKGLLDTGKPRVSTP